MRTQRLAWAALAAVLVSGTAAARGAKGTRSAAEFPFRVFRSVAKSQSSASNFLLSPYSVSRAFLLADLGARGRTRSQIEQSIDLKTRIAPPSADEGAPTLWIANRIWLARDVHVSPAYLASARKDAQATPGAVDFAGDPDGSAKTINAWVSEQTHDKIQELIPPGSLSGRTRVILTNAVYFKGSWAEPFKPALTKDGDFTLSSGHKESVPFMHQSERFDFAQDSLAQVIRLPYAGREFAMLIALPKAGVSLSQLTSALSTKRLAQWEKGMVFAQVELSLPRFKFESSFVLNDELTSLGVSLAFDPARADFSGIDGEKDLYVSKVFHKTFISVDEAGTEAAAATAIEMRMRAVMRPESPVVVRVDHPFVFMIQDLRSGAILFIGQVADPK